MQQRIPPMIYRDYNGVMRNRRPDSRMMPIDRPDVAALFGKD